MKGSMVNI